MDTIVLKNVKLRWPFLAKKNEGGEFSSNKYQVDVVLDGDNRKTVESLMNKKQKIKEKDGVATITLKSSVKPRVYNKIKALMTDEELSKVGNDSIAHVKVTQYESKYGKYLGLGSIKVLDVKEFTGDDDFGDDDDVFEDSSAEDDEDLI